MLRLKSAIRLTREDGQIFETLTGLSTLPTSIAQYNRALETTARHYHLLAAQEDSADAELLARIAEGELIMAEPASVPDER